MSRWAFLWLVSSTGGFYKQQVNRLRAANETTG